MSEYTITIEAVYVPRCGDIVLHRPTGEEWIVAYIEGDDLAWAGWPNGRAKFSDCDLVSKCSDVEHREWVARWSETKADSRAAKVARLYGGKT